MRKILTSRAFIKLAKLEALETELAKFATLIYLEDIGKTIDFGDKLVALVKGFFPRVFAAKASPDDTGVILFTSGSYGTPKGAVLSHSNIVANVEQAHAHIPFDPNWSFFCPLPMFHSFGLTGGVMLPIFTGHKAFLFPSPLQVKEIPKLIKDTGANVFFATDTFAQQYARNAADELERRRKPLLQSSSSRSPVAVPEHRAHRDAHRQPRRSGGRGVRRRPLLRLLPKHTLAWGGGRG